MFRFKNKLWHYLFSVSIVHFESSSYANQKGCFIIVFKKNSDTEFFIKIDTLTIFCKFNFKFIKEKSELDIAHLTSTII